MNPPNKSRRWLAVSALLSLLVCLAVWPATAWAQSNARPFGDAQVLATVPFPPGYPEGIAVKGNRVYVAGPARFGTAGGPPSKVFAYDTRTGETVREYAMQGETLALEHANSCIAFGDEDQLYVINTQLGIVRINVDSGQQTVYASPLPDLHPCVATPAPCSPTVGDAPPLPNDLA